MPLPSACQVCGPSADASPDSLLKCSRCQAVLYCGREHQSEDFASHKATCRRIKKMRERMAQEEAVVRNSTEDFWTPANAFKTHVGHFWGLRGTRPYMTAKLELKSADNLGIWEVIPTLMLILDQYQDAYDFIKWYVTSGNDPHYDWGNMDLPFLNVRNADMTEEIPDSMQRDRNAFFMSNVAYIKLMLAKTVKDAINSHEQGDHAEPCGAQEASQEAHEPDARGVLIGAFPEPALLEWCAGPGADCATPKPPHYAPGDINQVKLWVQQNAMLWRDHHDFIREKRSAYPDYLPEMPQRGIQRLVTFP